MLWECTSWYEILQSMLITWKEDIYKIWQHAHFQLICMKRMQTFMNQRMLRMQVKKLQSLTCYWLKEKVQLVRLPFTKHAMSLTSYWSQEKMQWNCLSQNPQCYSQAVGHRKRRNETAFHKILNVTHSLLVIEKMCLSQNVQCHSLPVGHMKRCYQTAFHKVCNVTHSL